MSKKIIRRKKNFWVMSKSGIGIQYADWELDYQKIDNLVKPHVRKTIANNFLHNLNTDFQFNLTNHNFFTLIAIKIQSCGVDDVFNWLIDRCFKNIKNSYSYPFLDEKIAGFIGPLTLEFLIKIDSLLNDELESEFNYVNVELLLKSAWERINRIQSSMSYLQLLTEAKGRGIPTMRHSDLPSYQLGYGFLGKVISKGFTSNTSKIGTTLATHKFLAQRLLLDSGCPVPKNFLVKTFEEALTASKELGFPVVVKPESTDKGVGVTVGVENDNDLYDAWNAARYYGNVLVEEMIKGCDHRLHVINGKCVYVTKRVPPYVIGDGIHKLHYLVDSYAAKRSLDPEYKNFPNAKLTDSAVLEHLKKIGISENSVLADGEIVYLRSNANVSTGGLAEEVTQNCHIDNILLAERAARVVGLDNAGIDLIIPDISIPWSLSCGKICEINPSPAFGKNIAYGALLDYLFPNKSSGKIPIILAVGSVKNLTDLISAVIAKQNFYSRSYGYIFDRKLYIKSNNGIFGSAKLPLKKLIKGLLSDSLVQSAFIQVNYSDLEEGLDIDYFNLIIANGNEAEISYLEEFNLENRCQSGALMINPSIASYESAIDTLFHI